MAQSWWMMCWWCTYPKPCLAMPWFTDASATQTKYQALVLLATLAQPFPVSPPGAMEALAQPVIHGVVTRRHPVVMMTLVCHYMQTLCHQCDFQGANQCSQSIPTLVARKALSRGSTGAKKIICQCSWDTPLPATRNEQYCKKHLPKPWGEPQRGHYIHAHAHNMIHGVESQRH